MKDLIHTIREDFQREGFTPREYFIFGIVAPFTLVALCILAQLIERA